MAFASSGIKKKREKRHQGGIEKILGYVADGRAHLADTSIIICNAARGSHPHPRRRDQQVCHHSGYINPDMLQFLRFDNPCKVQPQQLYFLKKLHKGPHCVRPIVSGSSGPTERLSAFMDEWLKPWVQQLQTYIRDSNHLIEKLETLHLPPDCLLATVHGRVSTLPQHTP